MPTLTLNGESRACDARTVAGLLDELGLAGQAVAVEVNEEVVPKKNHGKAPLAEGDHVELVTLVGGG